MERRFYKFLYVCIIKFMILHFTLFHRHLRRWHVLTGEILTIEYCKTKHVVCKYFFRGPKDKRSSPFEDKKYILLSKVSLLRWGGGNTDEYHLLAIPVMCAMMHTSQRWLIGGNINFESCWTCQCFKKVFFVYFYEYIINK